MSKRGRQRRRKGTEQPAGNPPAPLAGQPPHAADNPAAPLPDYPAQAPWVSGATGLGSVGPRGGPGAVRGLPVLGPRGDRPPDAGCRQPSASATSRTRSHRWLRTKISTATLQRQNRFRKSLPTTFWMSSIRTKPLPRKIAAAPPSPTPNWKTTSRRYSTSTTASER